MKKKKPARAAGEPTRIPLASRRRTELENEWGQLRGDTSAAASRRRVAIEEETRRLIWAGDLFLKDLKEDAPPAVRDILLAVMKLSTDEWRILSSRLHDYIHPEWTVEWTPNVRTMLIALEDKTNEAHELASRKFPRNRKRTENLEKAIRDIFERALPAVLTAGQILNVIRAKDEYATLRKKDNKTPLNRGDVEKRLRLLRACK